MNSPKSFSDEMTSRITRSMAKVPQPVAEKKIDVQSAVQEKFVPATDQELVTRALEIQNMVLASPNDNVAVLVDNNDDAKRTIAALIVLFGEKKVHYGGEPAFFPGKYRIVIDK